MTNVTDIQARKPRQHQGEGLEARLEAMGFRQDEFGVWRLRGWCDVSLYSACGEWELDVVTDSGALGCDTSSIAVGDNHNGGAA